jgi:hypothetical protein
MSGEGVVKVLRPFPSIQTNGIRILKVYRRIAFDSMHSLWISPLLNLTGEKIDAEKSRKYQAKCRYVCS